MSEPNLGDTVINRYTLVTRLRTVDGLQAWKASDRVLARDCQLFLVNDTSTLPHVNAIASSLALTRNAHFTRVLQLQHRGPVAIIVTALDGGLSLTDYLHGPASQTLSYEAIRSIVGECAKAQQQLLVDGLSHESISTDTIRITSTGVQITNAPISPMLSEMSGAPADLPKEQLAIRQLAAVLYSLLMRTASHPDPHFDIDALDLQTPGEFRLICARGLNISDSQRHDGRGVPMASLSELTALLGSWTPLDALSPTDIALPGIDGENSIVNARLRPEDPKNIVPIPHEIVAGSSFAGMTNSIFPMSKAPSFPPIPSRSASERIPAIPPHSGPASFPPATKGEETSLEPALPPAPHRDDATHTSTGINQSLPSIPSESETTTTAGFMAQDSRFHSIAAAEMADILSSPDSDTNSSFFAPLGTPEEGHQNNASTVQFDFSTHPIPVGAQAHRTDLNYHPRTESTGSIPVFNESGARVLPGQESARALRAEQHVKENAGAAGLPPSYVPESQQTSASEHPHVDLADSPLLSRFTTKVIAVFVIATIVAVALAFSLRAFIGGSTTGSVSRDSSSWPVMDLNDVPFGTETTSTSGSSSSTSTSSASSSSASASSSSTTSSSVIHADKTVSAVPSPSVLENNTAYDIDKQEFLTNPANEQGYGYYMHLSEKQTVYRFVINIRSSGGTGYLYANTTNDPAEGTQVAKFTFDASGTTDVKFTKAVKAQDFLLWVPLDSLPNNQLYINSVKLY
ncbi:virulence factor MviN [uncultured Bifidobacterium sp.]|uniref:virulence factor MviN n=1 Tax=uncultured Bifidobacterium sp. TaxID=165187 RepID=UPI0026237398|nr:virulence factor MviN [uncultured Bifidobacterium sp.]